MDEKTNPITLEHQGDHHLTKVQFDPDTKKVDAGAIMSFSENSTASIQVRDGKTKTQFVHSGDTHALHAGISEGGVFDLEYKDTKKGGIELEVHGDIVSLKQGKIPTSGLKINGDHHKLWINLDSDGKPSGILESKLAKTSSYEVEIKNGKLSRAEFSHSGEHHNVSIAAGLNGYVKVGYSHDKRNSKFSFGVERKGNEVKAFGGLKLDI